MGYCAALRMMTIWKHREMFINKDLGEKTIESSVTITIKIRMDMGN